MQRAGRGMMEHDRIPADNDREGPDNLRAKATGGRFFPARLTLHACRARWSILAALLILVLVTACAPVMCGWPVHCHWGVGGPFGWVLGLSMFALWVWTLIDLLTRDTDKDNQRLLWGLVVGFTYVVGAILYLIIRRPERQRTLGALPQK